jgi:hypothetical protein
MRNRMKMLAGDLGGRHVDIQIKYSTFDKTVALLRMGRLSLFP